MSLFFVLLPSDLQIELLHTWLNGHSDGSLVRALSALDIACARTNRQAWLSLLHQLPVLEEFSQTQNHAENILDGLQWLSSRQIAVKSLLVPAAVTPTNKDELSRPLALSLLSLETIVWMGVPESYALLAMVLRGAPNLSSLSSDCCYSAFTQSTSLPKLTTLNITGPLHQELVFLKFLGRQLLVLRVHSVTMTTSSAALIAGHCNSLRTLEITPHDVNNILQILEACHHLSDVTVHMQEDEEISRIIAEHPQLTRLTAHRYPSRTDCVIMADMLARRPELEYIQIAQCSYSTEGVLEFRSMSLTADLLERTLTVCPTIHTLMIKLTYLTEASAEIIGRKLGNRLTSVAVCLRHQQPLEILLQHCGASLKTLHLDVFVEIDDLLALIGRCVRLETLFVDSHHHLSPFSADDVHTLATCKKLKDVTFRQLGRLSRSFLQAILDNKMCLQSLDLLFCGFSEEDAEWLRNEAKRLQHLPVPNIVVVGRPKVPSYW